MATGTTVFSRVTVVAPRTRIDVALPADVAVADLLPMLLEMAGENSPDGGVRHGGWCLAKIGQDPLEPGRTLASLAVVDGDILQLRRRVENPPKALYDDVVDAIADADPDSFRAWDSDTARKLGHWAGGLAFIAAAAAVYLAGPAYPLAAAITAGVAAIVAVVIGAVVVRSYGAPTTGIIIAATGGLPMAFVAGLYAVPKGPAAPNVLLGFALVAVVAGAALMVIGAGVSVFIAAATVGVLGLLTAAVATFVDYPVHGFGAGAAAVALVVLSTLPQMTIKMAKIPLPHVPSNAEDLKEDQGFPDYEVIERRAGLAHEYMTGMIIGCGLVAAGGAVLAGTMPALWGPIFGAVVTAVLLLRARTYANGTQAVALLSTGILGAGGLLVGWMLTASPFGKLLWVFGTLVVLAALGLVLGVVFPKQRFSPPMRRSVDIAEAVFIAAVLPLALAVMELYTAIRHL
ncbi:type VII secretion integral membrane protein EccD [Crossiella equi]|uniref:Type VII secretion integral membrane protein EccD n=1 Tax=Crossiella equi TaxID=130796 RepID=A0ABS5AHY2_9PSEU|nr:type VII secretion integral membrane protein EccD [Crossiella equi]MBP2476183.1 type VII secretion integral membrane protein EccD [Crossiella equi]